MKRSRLLLSAILLFVSVGILLCSNTSVWAEDEKASQSVSEPAATSWLERRKVIERHWLDLLGDFPTEIPELRPEMKQVAQEEGITRYHVSFQTEPDDRVTAWLLVPDEARKRPTPAIICIHSTTFGAGKDSTIGLAGRRPQDPPRDPKIGVASGLELARHGFVTLSIDLLTDGERIKPGERVMDTRGFYLKHPEWSIVGKNTWDIMRSVDFLQTLDFVDGKQIGAIGWSLGGHTALFAAAFEPRITATISNGGVLDWHRHVTAWSRKASSWQPWKEGDPPSKSETLKRRFGFYPNSGPYIYIKKFRPYIDDQSKPIPVDFDSLMMMVAPRPLLIISSEQEFYRHKIFPKCLKAFEVYLNWQDVEGLPSALKARQERLGYDQTLEYYETQHRIAPERIPGMLSELGAGDCFSWFSFPGGHSYPGVARRFTFAWFDRWLGRTLD
ncbi:dienelactone hydrolase family protein [Gimesia algae]|uniref:Acetyl xylan esterase (AXE1) n=1 Tax=Gimesia algae TaxID=2527971 RepID=A0A517VLY5_9PLAN|nr:acetylxylan esterase [Gimesia algae]QDT93985.1 Acetyl xylan esterase (AXE1) [Gimesia algae]